jgi:acyl carrier protein
MGLTEDDIKKRIKKYIIEEQRVKEADLDEGKNLFEEGIVDSMGAFDLASFLETEFGVKFEEEHFFDQRFRSIRGMASLIMEIKAPHRP